MAIFETLSFTIERSPSFQRFIFSTDKAPGMVGIPFFIIFGIIFWLLGKHLKKRALLYEVPSGNILSMNLL
jgi:hypothetical protein